MWNNIICRFGIPWSIVIDNGPQFDSKVYKNFCHELKIINLYSTLWYPQSNGQAEASNKTILMALKKHLYLTKGMEQKIADFGEKSDFGGVGKDFGMEKSGVKKSEKNRRFFSINTDISR